MHRIILSFAIFLLSFGTRAIAFEPFEVKIIRHHAHGRESMPSGYVWQNGQEPDLWVHNGLWGMYGNSIALPADVKASLRLLGSMEQPNLTLLREREGWWHAVRVVSVDKLPLALTFHLDENDQFVDAEVAVDELRTQLVRPKDSKGNERNDLALGGVEEVRRLVLLKDLSAINTHKILNRARWTIPLRTSGKTSAVPVVPVATHGEMVSLLSQLHLDTLGVGPFWNSQFLKTTLNIRMLAFYDGHTSPFAPLDGAIPEVFSAKDLRLPVGEYTLSMPDAEGATTERTHTRGWDSIRVKLGVSGALVKMVERGAGKIDPCFAKLMGLGRSF